MVQQLEKEGLVGAIERPVQATIGARRTIRSFKDQAVPRDVVERALEAAVQAPNHKRTVPWRFYVVDGSGAKREELAQLSYEAIMSRVADPSDAGAQGRAEAKRQEVLNTPLMIAVFSVPGRNEMETKENYGAVCCAVQNLTLAAQEEGVAAGWSTGGICTHPRLAEVLGAEPTWDVVAMLYMGYAETTAVTTMLRGPAEKFTTWLSA